MPRSHWVRVEVTLDEKRALKILARRRSIKTNEYTSVETLVATYVRELIAQGLDEMEREADGS